MVHAVTNIFAYWLLTCGAFGRNICVDAWPATGRIRQTQHTSVDEKHLRCPRIPARTRFAVGCSSCPLRLSVSSVAAAMATGPGAPPRCAQSQINIDSCAQVFERIGAGGKAELLWSLGVIESQEPGAHLFGRPTTRKYDGNFGEPIVPLSCENRAAVATVRGISWMQSNPSTNRSEP